MNDINDERPCCAASAAKKTKMVDIDGIKVGIAQLDEIIDRISIKGLTDEEVARALMKDVKIFNYVPLNKEKEYQKAIMIEYKSRVENGQQN